MTLIFTKACALIPDLEILEDGDESEIGERGVSSRFVVSCFLLTMTTGKSEWWPKGSSVFGQSGLFQSVHLAIG